ncbi:hypothetical protein K431DRAFT_44584 [Polychaeton citri CBS 116435]|uniref:Uncharacterized protein n=1 Tax=Polychaeton citri CBS 116435 TaxID=1314669 RepID=A0A9P4Q8C3_9PEZI|nr:hypothetical protein K431DRAFT_44584 [Polychaeton citri CBS 116435]
MRVATLMTANGHLFGVKGTVRYGTAEHQAYCSMLDNRCSAAAGWESYLDSGVRQWDSGDICQAALASSHQPIYISYTCADPASSSMKREKRAIGGLGLEGLSAPPWYSVQHSTLHHAVRTHCHDWREGGGGRECVDLDSGGDWRVPSAAQRGRRCVYSVLYYVCRPGQR